MSVWTGIVARQGGIGAGRPGSRAAYGRRASNIANQRAADLASSALWNWVRPARSGRMTASAAATGAAGRT